MARGTYAYYASIRFKMSVITIAINIIIVLTTVNFELFICITGMTTPFSAELLQDAVLPAHSPIGPFNKYFLNPYRSGHCSRFWW